MTDESLERTRADLELVCAAYPDEVRLTTLCSPTSFEVPDDFPFIFSLSLTKYSFDSRSTAHITMEFPIGYPKTALRVLSCRGGSHVPKILLDAIASTIRTHAETNAQKNEECGLIICSSVCESWSRYWEEEKIKIDSLQRSGPHDSPHFHNTTIKWISGKNTINDKKSVFQAHVCVIRSESAVRVALRELIDNNSKIQRATHNMLENGISLIHHDNEDDGEDQAGSRLASLLELRKEDGILVVVSRWYGGIKLGPKRFTHIINVARELLEFCHSHGYL